MMKLKTSDYLQELYQMKYETRPSVITYRIILKDKEEIISNYLHKLKLRMKWKTSHYLQMLYQRKKDKWLVTEALSQEEDRQQSLLTEALLQELVN